MSEAPPELPDDAPEPEQPDFEGVTHAGMAVYAADTKRILLIQRSMDPTDPPEVMGTWEFPGGTIEEGEDSITAACREFTEETGLPVPEEGEIRGSWVSPDGVYEGFIYVVPVEAEAFTELNPDKEAAHVVNPDDPERRTPDVSAWFTIEQIKGLGTALRPEVAKTDWALFDQGDDMPEDKPTEAASSKTWAQQVEERFAKVGPLTDEEKRKKDDAPPVVNEPTVDDAKTPPDQRDDSMPTDEPVDPNADPLDEEDKKKKPFAGDAPVPFHTVLAVEGRKTGDGRRFLDNSLSNRPLPLPLTWQKVSAPGHDGNVVVAMIERIKNRTPIITQDGQEAMAQVADGHFLVMAEADEFMSMLAQFGKFGVSIDADSAVFTMNESDECTDFSEARTSGACAVAIPALYEAWVSIGEAPEEWAMDSPDEEAAPEALVAAAPGRVRHLDMFTMPTSEALAELGEAFKDLAPGKTEDGPGWLTHPVDTDRLRDYWVRGPGAAKIGWGTPGDFNRCRLNVGKYVKPQYLAGYCANRHFDALGFWPGRPVAGETQPFAYESMSITDRTPAESIVITASGAPIKAPAEWFSNPGFTFGDERLVEQDDGSYACPFTVLESGQVYGHIARWGQCHLAYADYCVTPPKSETNYAHYQTGAVLLDNGKQIPVGGISIGGGHAGPYANARQAAAHYDTSSKVAADVAVFEDDFGIAVAGWIRPGTSPEMVAALRASSVSGDWRPVAGHPQEMVAALAVNVPGFGVPRARIAASAQGQLSLVAAGCVPPAEASVKSLNAEFDMEALGEIIARQVVGFQIRREEIRSLAKTGRGLELVDLGSGQE